VDDAAPRQAQDETFELFGGEKSGSRERALWLAVIALAMADLIEPSVLGTRQKKARTQLEAEQFLLDTRGRHYRHRVEVCNLAGIDPDQVRNEALRRLEEATRP
jgi:hypothetical protein